MPISDMELEAARDELRDHAFNKSYIPPTNPDKVFLLLAGLYKSRMEKAVSEMVEAKKELSALKRAKAKETP